MKSVGWFEGSDGWFAAEVKHLSSVVNIGFRRGGVFVTDEGGDGDYFAQHSGNAVCLDFLVFSNTTCT